MSARRAVLVVQHDAADGPGAIGRELRARGLALTDVRGFAGDAVPESIGDAAGLVVMGGPMSLGDVPPHAFLAQERRLVASAIAAGVPVLGVCLGAQILASVLGGRVARAGAKEIGWAPVERAPEAEGDPLFGALPQRFASFHWHEDAIALPPGATLLARSRVTPVQAFRAGRAEDAVYGLQFHLESDAAMVETMVRTFDGELVAEGLHEERILEDTRERMAEQERLASDRVRQVGERGSPGVAPLPCEHPANVRPLATRAAGGSGQRSRAPCGHPFEIGNASSERERALALSLSRKRAAIMADLQRPTRPSRSTPRTCARRRASPARSLVTNLREFRGEPDGSAAPRGAHAPSHRGDAGRALRRADGQLTQRRARGAPDAGRVVPQVARLVDLPPARSWATASLTSERDAHARQRRLIAPALTHKRIATYADTMAERGSRTVAGWQVGQTFDASEAMMRLTLEIVGKTLFDAEVGSDATAVGRRADPVMENTVATLGSFLPMPPPFVPTPRNLASRRARKELDALVYGLIADRRREMSAGGTAERSDLLTLLLAARGEDGAAMTDRQVRDEAMTLFLAGHETTAVALSPGRSTCSRSTRRRARAPRRRPPPSRDAARRSPSRTSGRSRTRSPSSRRRCASTRPRTSSGGARRTDGPSAGAARPGERYRIKKNTAVLVNVLGIHRRPDLYPDPDAFDPARFLGDREKELPRCGYLPFGAGPRVCIGNHFALMEGHLILATIVGGRAARLPRRRARRSGWSR